MSVLLIDIRGKMNQSGVFPPVVDGSQYYGRVTADGGTPFYTYTIIDGALPLGLSLDGITGEITGGVSAGETSAFTVRATDLQGMYVDQQYVIIVFQPSTTYLTSQLYPVFLQDDADSPLLTGGSTDSFRDFLEPTEESLLTGGQTDQFDMVATASYSTYAHAQDDTDSPSLAGGETDTFDMVIVASYSTQAWSEDDTDSPSLVGGSTDQFTMTVVAGYQTYDWKQDNTDSPSLVGGQTDQFTMTTV